MEDWLLLDDPRLTLQLSYPATASDGEPVEHQETEGEGMLRVHLLAPVCREVYFEVSKHAALTPEAEYLRHKEYLVQRFDSVHITELFASQCAVLPAWEYVFEWDQEIRRVLLVERFPVMYRLLYNSRGPVNEQIFSTIGWLDRKETIPSS